MITFSLSANNGDPKDTASTESLFDLTYNDQVTKAILEVDMESLIGNKKTNEETDGIFHFTDKYGNAKTLSTKVRARGKFRRRVCDLPPLKLDFKKGELKEKGLKEYDKYKLVTHCLDSKEGKDQLLREYTAYKLYNQLTENSFRVQLLQIQYKDTASGETTDGYAILIEENDEMADRLGGTIVKDIYGMTQNELAQENGQIHALFQYMIGNTDWDIARLHNMKLIQTGNSQGRIAVPYDFDFAGLVNADYAIPNPNLKQTDIRQRIFMGQNFDTNNWGETMNLFKAKHVSMLLCIKDSPYLSKASKKDMMKFINSFYNQLETGIDS